MIMTGWEIEYYKNQNDYIKLFNEVLQQKQETDISFLEDRLAKMHDRKYAVACSSGTDALHLIMLALRNYGVVPGEEVLVPDFSWISTASCVAMTDAMPIFCDIDLDSYHMSLNSMKHMCGGHTMAIVYPHLFGNMSDTTEIEEWCEKKDLLFVEDACQSIGASYNGRKAGSIGIASALSFNANKNIAGIAGGGAILTDQQDIADYCRKARQHGNGDFLGYNSKMLLLNARVIDYRLNKMQEWQFHRQKSAELYDDALRDLPVVIQGDKNVNHNYHKYVVRFESKEIRDKVQRAIGAAVHYDKPLSENAMWEDINHEADETPNAKLVCDTILTLPLNHYTDFGDIIKTADTITDIVKGNAN